MRTIVTICWLICFHWASGQPATNPAPRKDKAYSKAIQQAGRYIDSLRRKQDIPGISVCIGTKRKIVWAEGFGLADVENQIPVSTETRFRLGSVSKSITSLAVGQLVQNGKLDLDAPIDQYVSYFPAKKFPITSRQLATHTAGIRHYRGDDPLNCLNRYENVKDGLILFSQDSLLFKPGTNNNYSTYGYSLLSAVIEQAAQTPFLTFMQSAVFTPFGMTHTSADYSEQIVPNRVRFYEHSKGQLVNANQVDNSYKWAGGGLLSTPSDLVIMGQGLLTYSILSQETVKLLFTPQLLTNGKNTQYGLGWRIGTDSRGRKIIHHGGTIDGGRTFLLLFPDNDLLIAITANMSGVSINLPEIEKLAGFFLK